MKDSCSSRSCLRAFVEGPSVRIDDNVDNAANSQQSEVASSGRVLVQLRTARRTQLGTAVQRAKATYRRGEPSHKKSPKINHTQLRDDDDASHRSRVGLLVWGARQTSVNTLHVDTEPLAVNSSSSMHGDDLSSWINSAVSATASRNQTTACSVTSSQDTVRAAGAGPVGRMYPLPLFKPNDDFSDGSNDPGAELDEEDNIEAPPQRRRRFRSAIGSLGVSSKANTGTSLKKIHEFDGQVEEDNHELAPQRRRGCLSSALRSSMPVRLSLQSSNFADASKIDIVKTAHTAIGPKGSAEDHSRTDYFSTSLLEPISSSKQSHQHPIQRVISEPHIDVTSNDGKLKLKPEVDAPLFQAQSQSVSHPRAYQDNKQREKLPSAASSQSSSKNSSRSSPNRRQGRSPRSRSMQQTSSSTSAALFVKDEAVYLDGLANDLTTQSKQYGNNDAVATGRKSRSMRVISARAASNVPHIIHAIKASNANFVDNANDFVPVINYDVLQSSTRSVAFNKYRIDEEETTTSYNDNDSPLPTGLRKSNRFFVKEAFEDFHIDGKIQAQCGHILSRSGFNSEQSSLRFSGGKFLANVDNENRDTQSSRHDHHHHRQHSSNFNDQHFTLDERLDVVEEGSVEGSLFLNHQPRSSTALLQTSPRQRRSTADGDGQGRHAILKTEVVYPSRARICKIENRRDGAEGVPINETPPRPHNTSSMICKRYSPLLQPANNGSLRFAVAAKNKIVIDQHYTTKPLSRRRVSKPDALFRLHSVPTMLTTTHFKESTDRFKNCFHQNVTGANVFVHLEDQIADDEGSI